MQTSADSRRFTLASCTLVVLLAWAGPIHADGRDAGWKEQPVPGLPAKGEGQAFRKGVVATANPYAAEAGAQVAEKGPSAALAPLATRCGVHPVRLTRATACRLAYGPF